MRSLAVGMLALLPVTADAYIGPGMAAGMIAVVLGILSAVCLAFIGIVWFPIKRLVHRRRKTAQTPVEPRHEAGKSGTVSG